VIFAGFRFGRNLEQAGFGVEWVSDSAGLGRGFFVRRRSRILRGVGREKARGSGFFCLGQ
jgi:hypothetical protein